MMILLVWMLPSLPLPRKSDGSLPYVEFLRLKTNSKLYNAGMGCFSCRGQ